MVEVITLPPIFPRLKPFLDAVYLISESKYFVQHFVRVRHEYVALIVRPDN